MPALIGLYSIPQILKGCLEKRNGRWMSNRKILPSPKSCGNKNGICFAQSDPEPCQVILQRAEMWLVYPTVKPNASKEPETFGKR